MTSYFDEKAVEQRVSKRFRRRFFWGIHLVIILGLAGLLIADAAFFSYWSYMRWVNNFTFGLFLSMPFVLHTAYFAYRELYERTLQHAMQQARMEAILEREEKLKRDHLPPSSLVYLSDDGELVDYEEEDELSDYRQRRKRH
jgi:hypothetical protein